MIVMSTPTAKYYVYGFLGYEQEIDLRVKTRVLFAIADEKQTQLAWYQFDGLPDVMLVLPSGWNLRGAGRPTWLPGEEKWKEKWQQPFDSATVGQRKLQRNEVFGEAVTTLVGLDTFLHGKYDLRKLAPPYPGIWGTLNLGLDDFTGQTFCMVFLDIPPQGEMLGFLLNTLAKRRVPSFMKTGRIHLVGVEPFSQGALRRGPNKAIWGKNDPYS